MLTGFAQLYLEARAKVELVTKNHDPQVISTPIRIKAVERSESRCSNWDVKLDILDVSKVEGTKVVNLQYKRSTMF